MSAPNTIELKLKTPHQLFDERDPSPFRERDLDDDAARYIQGSYRDLRDRGNATLSLHFESLGEFSDRPLVIVDAVHAFFAYEAESKRRELREIFRQGVIALSIGVAFLFACTSIGESMKASNLDWSLSPMLHEGLSIMGWVAMWRPISIFLYEWWPIRDELLRHRRLSMIPVEIRMPALVIDSSPDGADSRNGAIEIRKTSRARASTVSLPLYSTQHTSRHS